MQRLETLSRGWEAARLDPGLVTSTWWINHAAPRMTALLSADEPFADSKNENKVVEPLPYQRPPEYLFQPDKQPWRIKPSQGAESVLSSSLSGWDTDPMTIDEAEKALEEARRGAEHARDSALAAITSEWQTAADELARRTVTEQPSRTTALHKTNDLGALKASLAEEKDRSTRAIPDLFRDALNIDALVGQAKINSHGVVRPNISEAVKNLASGTYDILHDAGYEMGRDYDRLGSFHPNDVAVNAHGPLGALGRAVEGWDVARRALAQAVKASETSAAQNLWDGA